jgi:high-affinity Fe2+/Pb2+ permease
VIEPSANRVFIEFEIIEVVNEVWMMMLRSSVVWVGGWWLHPISDSWNTISNSNSDSVSVNDGNEQRTVTHDKQGVEMGGVQ